MTEKEIIEKIKQNKEVVKNYTPIRETFEVEIDGKRYRISREKVEDQLGDDFTKDLIKKIKES